MQFSTLPFGQRLSFWGSLLIKSVTGVIVLILVSHAALAAEMESPVPSVPGAICDDYMFQRRVWMVLAGRNPDVDDVLQLQSTSRPLDRAALVDRLLAAPEFGKVWGRWFSILTGCEEEPLSVAAFAMRVPRERVFWLWQSWIQDGLNNDRSCGDLVHDLLSADSRADGESLKQYEQRHKRVIAALLKYENAVPELGLNNDLFWKTNRSPIQNAELVARQLMGVRLECARCHQHPFADWSIQDHADFSAIFQRTVYAELPLTFVDKTRWIFRGMGIAALFSAILGWLVVSWDRQRRIRLALAALLMLSANLAATLYVLVNWLHVLQGSTAGKTPSLIVRLVTKTHGHWLVPISLIAAATVLFILSARFLRRVSVRAWRLVYAGGTAIVGAVLTLVAIDTVFMTSIGTEPLPVSMVTVLKEKVLQGVGLGGRGQQVREVYDDTNGNYVQIGRPRPLGGPAFKDDALSRPRRQFANWLLEEPAHQFDRNLVNRVAQRVFNQAFVTPVDNFLPDSVPRDGSWFLELTKGFRQQNRSLKWLLRTMLLSDRFQATDTTSDSLVYHPRALHGEEIIATLNQLSSVRISLADKWTPTPADPWTCGTEAPNRGELGDRLLAGANRSDSELDVPLQNVAILLIDPSFQDVLTRISLDASPLQTGSAEKLKGLAVGVLGRPLQPAEESFLFPEETLLKAEELLWALVNSQSFLILK
jgi:hypothetical protein